MKICPLNIKCEKFSLVLVFIASVLFYFPAISQNLLSNGDFELYSTLPTGTNQANRCIGWNRLNGTPDYYHANGFMNPTQWGVTPAKSGKGQMGIVTYWTAIDNYREYISSALTTPLIVGQGTRVCFYWRNGTPTLLNTIYSNNFGILFTNGEPTPISGLINTTPQWEAPVITQLLDGWALLTFDFVPLEAFTHLTIGNFRDDVNTLYTANPTNSSAGAYYYIDSLAVTQNFIPQLSIQGLTKICKGEATNLTAINGDTYSWATSLQPLIILGTGPEITVNPTETTNYFVYSSNDTASFTLNVVPYPIVTLGNDTSLCPGQSLSFTLSQSGVTYSWEDGSTSAERIINETGTYWVQLDRNGCIKSDTINLQIFNLPKPALGNDTSICAGDTLRLEIDNPDALITWQDGSTGNSFDVYSEGSFVVKVERFQCSLSDTVSILIKPQPLVNLGNDTTLCDGQSLILSVEQENSSYTWQDGSALPDYTVNSSGTYFVEVTKQGCKKADTLYVSLLSTSQFTLGNDTSFCFGNSITLNAETPGAIYLWQDGSTSATYLATENGTYYVAIDLSNCSVNDTLKLEVLPLPLFSLGPDTSLCKGYQLKFNFTGVGDSFLWHDGSVSLLKVIEDSGNSWLSITKAGCNYSDSLVVEVVDCPTSLLYPNVFSPNGDSYNEYFSPSANQGVTQLDMVIYNRWGNQVFSSQDLNSNWDGKDGEKPCPEGVYFWLVEFTDINGYRSNLRGSVTLIK